MRKGILHYLQPQAVWQLVVLALMAVVMPLAWLLYSTAISLQTLSVDSRQVTEQSVTLAENSRSARAALIDMERIARQFLVLQDPALLELYEQSLQGLLTPIRDMMGVLQQQEASNLVSRIEREERRLNTVIRAAGAGTEQQNESMAVILEKMAQDLESLVTLGRAHSETRLGALGHKATEVRQNVFQSALFLVPVTLLLIALFTVLIVRPIGHLQLAIRRLGRGTPKPIRLYGPNELVKLAEELNFLQQRLAQVEEQKQQFLRHVSHELKTPLASIREGISLLQDELVGSLTGSQKEVVRLVDNSGAQLQTLIEDLLQFNRLNFDSRASAEQESVKGRQSSASLNDEILHLLDKHWLPMSQKQMLLCLGGPHLRISETTALAAIMSNLLSNAIAYGSQGGRIWILWKMSGDFLCIDVVNTGPQIPARETGRIFDPFYQGSIRRSGAVKGSGIGLAIARETVQSLGGSLTLKHNADNLVGFRIRLPDSLTVRMTETRKK